MKDIENAEKIFGNDIASLKGKSTRRKPPIIKEDFIEIPPKILEHNKEITLNIDNMFICGLSQFTGIDETVHARHCLPLSSRTKNEFYKAINVIMRKYNSAGFTIKRINCDQEFQPIMDLIKDDMDIEMNYAPAQDRTPRAERNNRVLQERIRAMFHWLPTKPCQKLCAKQLE